MSAEDRDQGKQANGEDGREFSLDEAANFVTSDGDATRDADTPAQAPNRGDMTQTFELHASGSILWGPFAVPRPHGCVLALAGGLGQGGALEIAVDSSWDAHRWMTQGQLLVAMAPYSFVFDPAQVGAYVRVRLNWTRVPAPGALVTVKLQFVALQE